MSGNKRTLLLLIALVIVVIIYFVMEQLGDRESNFRTAMPAFDTAMVNRLEINAPPDLMPFSLSRQPSSWNVISDGQEYAAEPYAVRAILASLNGTGIRFVAGTDEGDWGKYNLADTSAIRVRFMNDDKLMGDVQIGRFEYIQPESQEPDRYGRRPQGEMISYVRIGEETPVYAIDGMIALGIGKTPDDYRSRMLLRFNPPDLRELTVDHTGGAVMKVGRSGDRWLLNGQPADSAAVDNYLRKLANLRGNDFTDREPQAGTHYAEMKVETGNGKIQTLEIYRQDTLFLITTTENPTNRFLESGEFIEGLLIDPASLSGENQ